MRACTPISVLGLRHIQVSISLNQVNLITLGEPQNYMFGEMRAALAIDRGTDILDHIYSLSPSEQEAAHAKIQAIERKAMELQVPQAGLVTLMEFLDKHEVKKGICTRNFE